MPGGDWFPHPFRGLKFDTQGWGGGFLLKWVPFFLFGGDGGCLIMIGVYKDKYTVIIILYSKQKDGHYISWKHLTDLYERDKGKATGIAMASKLKFEHINLTSFAKMRVDLAAQASQQLINSHV